MTTVNRRLAVLLALLLGCRATTARPYFVPYPEAETAELGFGVIDKALTVGQVTDTLLAYLVRDSIPINKVRRFDGFLETGWFDAATLAPTTRRPVGDKVVRVRAYIDPGKPGFTRVEVETVFVPFPDPSLSAREQEAPVTPVHPVNRRVAAVLAILKKKYGAPEDTTAKKKNPKDSTATLLVPTKPDTTQAKADTTKAKADTTKAKAATTGTKAPTDTTKVKAAADTTKRS